MTSDTDPRFGRASFFVVVDTDTGNHEVVDNSRNLNAAQGAGVMAAEAVAKMKVDAVATGHCGPKAFRVLNAAGIKVYAGVDGTVETVVNKLKAGEYREADAPDVEGHW